MREGEPNGGTLDAILVRKELLALHVHTAQHVCSHDAQTKHPYSPLGTHACMHTPCEQTSTKSSQHAGMAETSIAAAAACHESVHTFTLSIPAKSLCFDAYRQDHAHAESARTRVAELSASYDIRTSHDVSSDYETNHC